MDIGHSRMDITCYTFQAEVQSPIVKAHLSPFSLLYDSFPHLACNSRVTNDGHRLVRLLEMFDLLFRKLNIDCICARHHETACGVKAKRERNGGVREELTD